MCVARVAEKALVLNVMAERSPRRLKIGQGNDVVDEWMGRCGSEIYVIIDFLKRVDQGAIEIDWSNILAGIPGMSSDDVDGLIIEGKNDILQLLEMLPGISVESQRWGGEMPGRDGIWIEVCTYGKDGTKVFKATSDDVSLFLGTLGCKPRLLRPSLVALPMQAPRLLNTLYGHADGDLFAELRRVSG
jgi:hypothetical protein